MAQIAFGVVRLQAHLEVEAPKAGNPVLNLKLSDWRGNARDAADTRAESLTRWIRNTADEFGDVAEVLQTGATIVRNAITALESRTTLADSRGYILDRGSRGYAINFDPARAPDGAQYDAGEAFEHQSALSSLATAADDTVTATRDGINGALGEIGGITPASVAQNRGIVDPKRAASDTKAVMAGSATPEQLGRYRRAFDLTPEQLDRIRRGENANIERSRLEYIRTALELNPHPLGGMAVTGALEFVDGIGSNWQATEMGRHALRQADQGMLQTTGKFLSRGASAAGVAVTMYDEYRKYDAGLQDGGDAIASGAGASPEGPSAVLWRVLLSALSLDR
ncbi:hypothetical protein [Gordonia amicalis]|uniref:hypothetical protein n=1 Tax=Gordonia amicalis TaxID=89053 RepID=UPI0003483F43|nr:hypothetical protein [Gordonia amicalis]MDV7102644.1 hypothetical protein [Gordonia amicalis]MDV7172594.1 hypothetical protein [Gordonia amicalis]UKO92204.1 hypothetical protein IHQ52_01845 [Gordonia amicalis]UOG19962.1 hypothetical protein MTX80_11835 [Gordonia amicalis]